MIRWTLSALLAASVVCASLVAGWALVVRSDVGTAEVDLGCRVLTADAVARVLGTPVVVEADCVRVVS